MKKRCILLIIVLCMFMSGCNNKFAEYEYDSVEKIAQNEDRYVKSNSAFNKNDKRCTITFSKFDGRETLWKNIFTNSQSVKIRLSFVLTKGKAKIVHIDANDNVTTLIECTPETSTEGYITKTISMTSGENRLKIIGYDCENIDFDMIVSNLDD